MKKLTAYLLLACSSALVMPFASAQAPNPVPADNAKSNKSDASNATATADAQTNKATDIDLSKRIRQSVMADKALSTYAHNIKIVSVNGHVTLNGVVRSDNEGSDIQRKAADIAGAGNVTNHLKTAPSKP